MSGITLIILETSNATVTEDISKIVEIADFTTNSGAVKTSKATQAGSLLVSSAANVWDEHKIDGAKSGYALSYDPTAPDLVAWKNPQPFINMKNNTGSVILAGSLVIIDSTGEDSVKLASGEYSKVLGAATEDIAINDWGKIQTEGIVTIRATDGGGIAGAYYRMSSTDGVAQVDGWLSDATFAVSVAPYDMSTQTCKVYITPNTLLAYRTVQEDGWVQEQGPLWVYVSATSFTVSGNHTSRFTKGTRLKWWLFSGTADQFGVVINSSYSSGTGLTTVTLAANSDYSFPSNGNSNRYYSHIDSPAGWPGWFNYVTTLAWTATTAPTGTPSIDYARFNILGKICFVNIYKGGYTAGNAVTAVTATLPVTPNPTSVSASGSIRAGTTPNTCIALIATTARVYCTSVAATALDFSTNYEY